MGGAIPFPGLPAGTYPLFQTAENEYVTDLTVNQNLPANATKANAILAAEANALVALVNQAQAQAAQPGGSTALRLSPDGPVPQPVGGGTGNPIGYPALTINSNALYICLTQVTNFMAYGSLCCSTGLSSFYTLFSTSNLLTLWPF